MKSRNLVVCDTEEEYAKALAMFFMRKKELMLQVHVCSSVGHAEALGKELRADILLAAAECAGKSAGGKGIRVEHRQKIRRKSRVSCAV